MVDRQFDVVIIGSGAGGGTMLHALAGTGARILVVERGEFVPQEDANWDPIAVWKDLRYRTTETWVDAGGEPFSPYMHYNVGGNSKFWGSVLYRLRREDFGELRHRDGLSPAWPIDYDTLAPYYDRAERLYSVHGATGDDPTEPSRGPYPNPPIPHAPGMARLADQFRGVGLHPSPLPLGLINPGLAGGCILCRTCNSFPCKLHAKSDADVCCVRPALAQPTVTLWTNSYAARLVTDGTGTRIVAAEIDKGGEPVRVEAPLFVVSCGAVNSAALLLRSATAAHPNGLANSSGLAGRNYMAHVATMLQGVSWQRNHDDFQKTLAVNDFYFGSRAFTYPMGHISFVGKLDAVALSAGAPPLVPGITLDVMAKHSLDFWLTSEDLPDPSNRVTLDKDGNIVLSYTPNNLEGHKRLTAALEDLLQHLGAERHLLPRNLFVGQRIPLAGVAHQNGTIRFGHDPKRSALDVNCKAHEVDNLYVVDGSFFPSSAAVNPALTIMANALRVGDRLIERMN